MKIGYYKVTHVPSTPVYLSGYPRTEKSEKVHLTPEISALTIEIEQQSVVFCVVDTILISTEMTQEIRKRVAMRTALPFESIHICATHTHSAPCIYQMNIPDPPMDEAWQKKTIETCVDVICISAKQLQPCTCTYQSLHIEGLYGNRNDPQAYANKELYCLHFFKEDQQIGRFLNISCHNTINSTENVITSDLFGAIRKELETDTCFCMITNGISGDVSTRYYRQGTDCKEVERIGHIIAEQVKMEEIGIPYPMKNMYTDIVMTHAFQNVQHDPYLCQKQTELKRKQELNQLEEWDDFTLESIQMHQRIGSFYHFLESSIIFLGDIILVTIPGEALSYFDHEIRMQINDHPLIFLGTTDGYAGYLVHENQNDFESDMAEVSIHDVRRHMQRIIQKLQWMTSTYCGKK